MKKSGHQLAPAVLYHGCRQRGRDDLYADELEEWEKAGVVAVKRTFSKTPQVSRGLKYIQDAVWADRDALKQFWRQGCFLYVCGSNTVSQAVSRLAVELKRQTAQEKGQQLSEADAEE
jgi:cytochrome P450 / NADPH-cytochrome P450 reductase